MGPNYLQYAQLINQAGDRSGALSQLGQTLDHQQAMDMQRQQMARQTSNDQRQNRLADLQLRAGNLNLAQDRAKSLATIGEYGTGDREGFENQLAAAEGFKAQEAKMAVDAQREADQTRQYFQTVKMMKESGATPESITAFSKVALKQNPKYASIADQVAYMDDTKMVITREVGENQLPDPTQPGKFLPPGKYDLEGVATGDPANPYKFNKIMPAKPQPSEYKSRERIAGNSTIFEESQDGGKTWKQVSTGPRYKPAGVTPTKERDLPPGIQDKLSTKMEVYNDWSSLADTFKPEYMPGKGFKNLSEFQININKIFANNPDAADWWTRYFDARNIILKERSGAAVMEPEFRRFEQGTIAANTNPGLVKNYLDRSKTKYKQHVDAYLEANRKNHPESIKSFETAYGYEQSGGGKKPGKKPLSSY